jgi:site-specific DNA recombinase
MTRKPPREPEAVKQAAIYTRMSKDAEGRELGVKRQEEDCRVLAERLGAKVVAVYVDNDVSASTRSKKPRPQFDEMMQAAQRGEFRAILAYSNSRLTRRPAEWNLLIDLHERHGVDIHTVASGSADLSRADGRAVARTIAAWDAAEAERISERVSRAKQQAAEQGLNHGGSRAFGWTDNVHLDPVESEIVREWAQRVLSGESLNSIRRDMTARNIPTVTGVPWNSMVIKQALVNPRLAGWRTHHGEILTRGVWEPILDETTWQQVRNILTDPARDTGIRGRVNLLTSLAVCGYCDQPIKFTMSVSNRVPPSRQNRPNPPASMKRVLRKYHCPDCRLYRAVALVDRHVEAYIVELLTNLEDQPDLDVPPDSLVAELRQRIRNNVVAFADSDVMSAGEFKMMQGRLKARLSAEEAKLAVPRRSRLVLGMTGERAAEQWEVAPLERKRKIIDAFIEVRLYRGKPGSNSFQPDSIGLIEK